MITLGFPMPTNARSDPLEADCEHDDHGAYDAYGGLI
jgi:hypothetical protein